MIRITPEISKCTPILLITTHGSIGTVNNQRNMVFKSVNNKFDNLSIIYHYPIGVSARQTFNNKVCSKGQPLNNAKSFIRGIVPGALTEILGLNTRTNTGNLSSIVYFEHLLQTILFKNEAKKKLGINIECLSSNINNNIVYNTTTTRRSNRNLNSKRILNYQTKVTKTRNIYNLHNVLKGEEYIEKSFVVNKNNIFDPQNRYCRDFKLTLYYFDENYIIQMIDILPEIYTNYKPMSLSYILSNVYDEINKPQSNYIYKNINNNLIVLDMTCNIIKYSKNFPTMNTLLSGPPITGKEPLMLFRNSRITQNELELVNFVHNLKKTNTLKKPQTISEIYNNLPYSKRVQVRGLNLFRGVCSRLRNEMNKTIKYLRSSLFNGQRLPPSSRQTRKNKNKKIKKN